jgi:HlyD family secretion protein
MSASRSRRPTAVLGIVIAIALVGAAGYWLQPWHRPPGPLIGIVHETEIRIAPEASGRLASVKVRRGQVVHKGDVLAVLSSPELAASVEVAKASAASARANRANVDAGVRQEEVEIAAQNITIAKSNLTLAQQQYDRAATLASSAFVSKQKSDESTAALSEAKANLSLVQATYAQSKAGPTKEERAVAESQVVLAEATIADVEAKLAKTTLTSPVDGVVRLVVAEPGEAISPGQPVMTLEAGRERWFTFTMREDRLGDLTMGSPVRLLTSMGDAIAARVTELRPLGEFAVWRAARAVGAHDVNSFLLRADPIGPTPALEPGMTVWINPGSVSSLR